MFLPLIFLTVHWAVTVTAARPKKSEYIEPFFANQTEYIKLLDRAGLIKSDVIRQIVRQVERRNYVHIPYDPRPVRLGFEATFSPLQMQVTILEKLEHHLKEGSRVLDVGSGLGYLTVCMALMVGKTGRAVGIEHIPELVSNATVNVMKDKPELLEEGRIKFIEGDGRLGVPELGPYDAIHVGCFAEEVPKALIEQLKVGGRLLITIYEFWRPVLQPMYSFTVVDKHGEPDNITKLVDREGIFIAYNCEALTDRKTQLTPTSTVKLPYFLT